MVQTRKKKTISQEDNCESMLSEELFSYAINKGCKTKEQFLMFFRARESIMGLDW